MNTLRHRRLAAALVARRDPRLERPRPLRGVRGERPVGAAGRGVGRRAGRAAVGRRHAHRGRGGGSAAGTVWVLERASDGARASIELAGRRRPALSVAAGTVVVVTAISTGWVLSAAGQAIAFVPNEIGAALLYNERVTR